MIESNKINDGSTVTLTIANKEDQEQTIENSEITSSMESPSLSSENNDTTILENEMDSFCQSSEHSSSPKPNSKIAGTNLLASPFASKKQSISSAFLLYSLLKLNNYRQKKLTAPPLVFHQNTPQNIDICRRMGWTLKQSIRPSMIATSGIINSIAAYARGGPVPRKKSTTYPKVTKSLDSQSTVEINGESHTSLNGRLIPGQDHFHFREIMTMGSDGSKLAIDWELPDSISSPPLPPSVPPNTNLNSKSNMTIYSHPLEYSILNGPIQTPIVLILHGINNDASFGYMQRLMRTCTDRGWIAAGMNFRGCGGVPLETPRLYNAAYTGDLRSVVNKLSHRLELAVKMGLMNHENSHTIVEGQPAPVFLVGNSLGANILVKYLGEEGLASKEHPISLPRCVAGGISLGNPLVVNSENLSFPWGQILGLGLKKTVLLQYPRLRQFRERNLQTAISKALWHAQTVGEIDKANAAFMIRNEPTYPFSTKIGYSGPDGGPQYWKDASSYTHVENVTVPLLKITAQDDFLVAKHAVSKINHCLHNPNLIIVKTKSGGHLGWFHVGSEKDACGIFGRSWADQATADFIAAVIEKKADEILWKKTKVSNEVILKQKDEIERSRQEAQTISSKL